MKKLVLVKNSSENVQILVFLVTVVFNTCTYDGTITWVLIKKSLFVQISYI